MEVAGRKVPSPVIVGHFDDINSILCVVNLMVFRDGTCKNRTLKDFIQCN